MKGLINKFTIALAIGALIVACTGGTGGGLAGIGGSGYIATGTVTGFGSIYVNGIKFNTDSASFIVGNNTSASQLDLNRGMVVNIRGSINTDGTTGTATEVYYAGQLQGPVAGLLSPDLTTKLFSVLGITVRVDLVETVFENTSLLDFSSLSLNNVIEISGYYDQNQVLNATYVRLKEASFTPSSVVEVQGVVENLSGSQFTVNNVQVDASSAVLTQLDNGLQNGVPVRVRGTYDGTLRASLVQGADIRYDENRDASLEGIITRFTSISNFELNGVPVNASGAIPLPANLQLAVGLRVVVDGRFSNGILIADRVEAGTGEVEIHAEVLTADGLTGLITIQPLPLSTIITVTVDASTLLEDETNTFDPLSLTNLVPGDFVRISGYETLPGVVKAHHITLSSTGNIALQGKATLAVGTSLTGGSITVLGVIFPFDVTTVFVDQNEVQLNATQINNLILTVPLQMPVLRMTDSDGDGYAEWVEIEQ